MNLKELMIKVEHHNELAVNMGNSKFYVRFDDLEFDNLEDAINEIRMAYLNPLHLLNCDMKKGKHQNHYIVEVDDYKYDVNIIEED